MCLCPLQPQVLLTPHEIVGLKILDNPATSSTSSLVPDDSAGRATLWHPAVQMHDAEVAAGP